MRVKLIIQYSGTNYSGWQAQNNTVSIQTELENAIKKVTGETVSLVASGRTDAGVHAYAQIAHFDTSTKIPAGSLNKAINTHLKNDISVLSSEEVSEEFHARFSAKAKTYVYNFYVGDVNLPMYNGTHAHVKHMFNFERVNMCISAFAGVHDYAGFMSTGSNVVDTVREIYDITLTKTSDVPTYQLRVRGNGFLYNMVRIIMGTLFQVGAGKINPSDIEEIIAAKDRSRAGQTAPACGLALESVEY